MKYKSRLVGLKAEVEAANRRAADVQRELAELDGVAANRQAKVDEMAREMQQ